MEDRPKRTEALRFRVTPDERAWLQRVAQEEGVSHATIIRRALQEFYSRRVVRERARGTR